MFSLSRVKSLLFTPAHKPQQFDKANTSGADILIIDLEDSLPFQYKESIHQELLGNTSIGANYSFGYRINPLKTIYGLKDILFIREHKIKPKAIVVPMVELVDEITILRELLPDIKIIATIETPKGLCVANNIALVSDALIFGAADYCARLGVLPTGESLLYPRNVIATAAASVGIPAFDSACFELSNFEHLAIECEQVKRLGFSGKAAIHPAQVEVINQSMIPSESDILWAISVSNILDELSFNSIQKVNNSMIGPPFIEIANKILARVPKEVTNV